MLPEKLVTIVEKNNKVVRLAVPVFLQDSRVEKRPDEKYTKQVMR